MDRVSFQDGICYFDNKPVIVDENETCYILKDINNSDNHIAYIEYSVLLSNSQIIKTQGVSFSFDALIGMATVSRGPGNIPTICLIDCNDFDSTIKTFTSVRGLAKWLCFISKKCHRIDDVGFEPEKKFPIYNLINVMNINFDRLNEYDKECFTESSVLFDFKSNLAYIDWWDLVVKKHNYPLRLYNTWTEVYAASVTPKECFSILNHVMRLVCVWESPYYPIRNVLAATVVFVYFLHDTGSSLTQYTCIMPILQKIAVSRKMVTSNNDIEPKYARYAMDKYRRALKSKNRSCHMLHLKISHITTGFKLYELNDLMYFVLMNMGNLFNDCESFDHLLAYLKTVFAERKKPELLYYVSVYSLALIIIRLGKIKSYNLLDNLEMDQIRIKNIEPVKKQISLDIQVVCDVVNPFIQFLDTLSASNSLFDEFCLDDETVYYFMQTNDSLTKFIDYILKTILPIISSYIKESSSSSSSAVAVVNV